MHTAMAAVGKDSERLAAAGLTPKTSEKTGIIGCTQYSSAEVELPAQEKASVVRRDAAVPRSMMSATAITDANSKGTTGTATARNVSGTVRLTLRDRNRLDSVCPEEEKRASRIERMLRIDRIRVQIRTIRVIR